MLYANTDKLTKNKHCIAIVCNQWGDTGKGKFVDLFSDWADVIVRGTGGGNAGHTLVVNDQRYIFHLIPSGILYDSIGKINVIGRGVAFDPRILCEELEILNQSKKSYNNLKISHEAPLMLPYHLLVDRINDKSEKVGTTGRGIGPLYSDYYARKSLFVNDMLNKDLFAKKLRKFLAEKEAILKSLNKELAKKVLSHEHLCNGAFFDKKKVLNLDSIVEFYTGQFAEQLSHFITETSKIAKDTLHRQRNVLLEGAQGTLLSIDYGTTRYQTSSDCSIEGLAKGSGLKEKNVDLVLGITKAFYMTRVGNGPFPTEFGGKHGETWCDKMKKEEEQKEFTSNLEDLLNDEENTLGQGIATRILGNEYGATTGRLRRTGWLDLVALEYSMGINGKHLALTKLDVLSKMKKIKLCTSYTYHGSDMVYADQILENGDIIDEFPRFSEILEKCEPNYLEFDGWMSDIYGETSLERLPKQLMHILEVIENLTGAHIDIISTGPDRNHTIVR